MLPQTDRAPTETSEASVNGPVAFAEARMLCDDDPQQGLPVVLAALSALMMFHQMNAPTAMGSPGRLAYELIMAHDDGNGFFARGSLEVPPVALENILSGPPPEEVQTQLAWSIAVPAWKLASAVEALPAVTANGDHRLSAQAATHLLAACYQALVLLIRRRPNGKEWLAVPGAWVTREICPRAIAYVLELLRGTRAVWETRVEIEKVNAKINGKKG